MSLQTKNTQVEVLREELRNHLEQPTPDHVARAMRILQHAAYLKDGDRRWLLSIIDGESDQNNN